MREEKIDAMVDAVAEIQADVTDIVYIRHTEVALVRKSVLLELEACEVKYVSLRKKLDQLDEFFSDRRGLYNSQVAVDISRHIRKEALKILRSET
jgi:hypothetical protein